ncbi:MAG: PHA/PHB synthase family protein [Alphaproteobacteria bacterium]
MKFAQNMARAAESFQKALASFLARQTRELPDTPFDPFNLSEAYADLVARMMKNPGELVDTQLQLWRQYAQLWQATTSRMMGQDAPPLIKPAAKDHRFADEAWQQNALFDFIKQYYLLTTSTLLHAVHEGSKDMDPRIRHKLEFYTRQFVDAMSPSNFILTNPKVIKETLESNGQNLVKGFENLLHDLQRGDGRLRIRMTDLAAFKLGENIAATPGKVVFENELMQLIQYAPSTNQVHQVPLLLIPAWINKYYILDLKPENSFAKWLVDQGYTVFMISWVNPDEKLSNKSFDDYMQQGPLAAMEAIRQACGEEQVSLIGYCLGGTLLAATLSWLTSKKLAGRIASATYLTTMIDFTEAGDLSVFIDDEQIDRLETRMSETGFLDAGDMAMTFNMLRANDLIWSFVVNQYLLGKDPFPFDLLYWNMDSTRMPAAMHSYYLRNMYSKNLLAKPGGLKLSGEKIDLTKIKAPSYILSTREDHIAPWRSTYAATQLYGGPVQFVLAASGHVAGVVNPPARDKYSYWSSSKKSCPATPDAWFESAKETHGSWWPHWTAWHNKLAGEKVQARTPGKGKLKAIEDAPGRYVSEQA